MREICFDTETTGFKAKEGDRILEIGCVELPLTKDGDDKVFHVLINPEMPIPEEATDVHGITDEKVADKPKFAEIVDDFLAFIEGARLIAHNAEFDENFIDQELLRLNKGHLRDYCAEIVDSLEMAKKAFPQQRNSLDVLCQRLDIDKSARASGHGALLDAKLLAQVYVLLKQRQETFDIDSEDDIPQAQNKEDTGIVILANEEELAAHEAFLDLLEKKNKEKPNWRLSEEEFQVKREAENKALADKKAALEHFINSL
ncbi:MAG: DNA polymerase III subunit epsilon [Burkholderiales bacterium]|nr:DNA polymerase III subunit epsilon [Burkholderiales bacterium]